MWVRVVGFLLRLGLIRARNGPDLALVVRVLIRVREIVRVRAYLRQAASEI